MSWLISRAMASAFLTDVFPHSTVCAQLCVIPSAQPFWRNTKPMDACRFSRLGLTSEVLTIDRSEALLRWFREVLLASESLTRAQGADLIASSGTSALKWLSSFARWNRETASWEAAQRSLLNSSTEFSQTWPSSGSMLNGECWERPTLEGPIAPHIVMTHNRAKVDQERPVCLELTMDQVEKEMCTIPLVRPKHNRGSLSRASEDMPTTGAATFPTPTVAMRKGSSIGALTRNTGKSRMNDRLDYRIEGSGLTGRLNPTWVEWLMGWPIGWTALQPLAMDRFREWQRQHGDCSSSG